MRVMRLLILLFLTVVFCAGCSPRKSSSEPVVIGGSLDSGKKPTAADEMLIMQEKEKQRQEREIQDLKRQEYYDEKLRRYLKQ